MKLALLAAFLALPLTAFAQPAPPLSCEQQLAQETFDHGTARQRLGIERNEVHQLRQQLEAARAELAKLKPAAPATTPPAEKK